MFASRARILLFAVIVPMCCWNAQAQSSPPASVELNFFEAPIKDLVQLLSQCTGENFIVGADTRQRRFSISSSSPEVPCEDAEQAIHAAFYTVGLSVRTQGTFRVLEVTHHAIVPNLPIFVETRVQSVKHISVTTLQLMLQHVASDWAHVTPTASGKYIVITDESANIQRIVKLIHRFDLQAATSQHIWAVALQTTTPSEMLAFLNRVYTHGSPPYAAIHPSGWNSILFVMTPDPPSESPLTPLLDLVDPGYVRLPSLPDGR